MSGSPRRLPLWLLAALLGLLLLLAQTAPVRAASTAETRIGASTLFAATHVGIANAESGALQPGNSATYDGIAVGDLFATDAAVTAASTTVRVLGSNPLYRNVAEAFSGKAFNVPQDIWELMSADEQWAANRLFLDRGIANGDPFLVVTGGRPWGTGLTAEIKHLMENGYDWTSNGLGLAPSG